MLTALGALALLPILGLIIGGIVDVIGEKAATAILALACVAAITAPIWGYFVL